jgi:hypothetical protein
MGEDELQLAVGTAEQEQPGACICTLYYPHMRRGSRRQVCCRGARRMLAQALEAEVEAYLEAARGERDERGHALVVRTGYAKEREDLLGAGTVVVCAPRVNDRRVDEITDQRKGFKKSVILPT